jgi:hypothetical protein
MMIPDRLTGKMIGPEHPRYPVLRSTYVAVASPAAIAVVEDELDIAAALELARSNEWQVSVRSGGHGLSGRSSNNGGLVIDLSALNDVDVIDPDRRLVRVGAGARWGTVAETLAAHGFVISSGDHGNVGVGGLATSAGIGWLARSYGLTIDHVRAASVVLSDGTALRADEDLLWTIRGAGGGAGIVTSFEIEATDLKHVGVAQIAYEVDRDGVLLQQWAETMQDAPRRLTTSGMVVPYGDAAALVLTAVVADADPDAIRSALAPLIALRPLQADAQVVPYTELVSRRHQHPNVGQQRMVSSSALFTELTPDAARALMDAVLDRAGMFLQLRSLGGAINDVDEDATAYAHRRHQVLANGAIPQSRRHELRALWQPVIEHSEGTYVNFESDLTAEVFDRAYPGDTGARVLKAWHSYDPDAILRLFPL